MEKYDMKPIVTIMDDAIAKLSMSKKKFIGKWNLLGVCTCKDCNDERKGDFAKDLDQLILSILDKLATKIEEETSTENREEDNLVEHIVNEIRKYKPSEDK